MIAAVLYGLWREGWLLPGWIRWESCQVQDVSGDYELTLNRRKVDITYKGAMVFASQKEVKVQSLLCSDIDGDGAEEFVLLCWKRGRYGEHKPFWVKRDEWQWSQHIFVYEGMEGKVRPKWMSSYIGQDVTKLEGALFHTDRERLLLTDREGKVNAYVWEGFGFAREERDISFAVFGDILIHEPIYRYGLSQGDFSFLFENQMDRLKEYDVTVINQETPFVKDPSAYSDYPRFGTPVEVEKAIKEAGFDVVTCATNHALDQGAEGVNVTKTLLQEDGITPTYRLVETQGPPHDRTFVTQVFVGVKSIAKGVGRTKKESESQAAKSALEILGSFFEGKDSTDKKRRAEAKAAIKAAKAEEKARRQAEQKARKKKQQ